MLWDQKSPMGYLKICAIWQKFVDQGISVNTSYNPAFYEDEQIPMSELLQHVLFFYKMGGKQLYYFQTQDGQGEVDVEKMTTQHDKDVAVTEDEDCLSCKI